ncbi:MAG: 30S ribosomal protein S5 [Planctomycetota bacterium]
MAEMLDEGSQIESNTIGIFRSAATVAGGRRFSFGSLVAVGNRRGRIGIGYGRANEVPPAIEKAQKDGRKSLVNVQLKGGTIPHVVEGRYGASKVRVVPASPGTGVIAGATVRAVLELAGITDCLTKSYGSNNKKNLAKATLDALTQLRNADHYEEMRGVSIGRTEVDAMLERGEAAIAKPALKPSEENAKDPDAPAAESADADTEKKNDDA